MLLRNETAVNCLTIRNATEERHPYKTDPKREQLFKIPNLPLPHPSDKLVKKKTTHTQFSYYT